VIEKRDVTGPLPRVPRDAAEIRSRGEALLDEVADRSKAGAKTRLTRLRITAPLIGQSAVAAGISWYLARRIGAGAGPPFFAPIAAVVSIGSALGQRLRRTVELIVGVSLGIGLGDLISGFIGNGTAAIMLMVALAMSSAVLLDGGQLLVSQAASSSVLVATLTNYGGTAGFDRCWNALLGGAVGITVGLVLLPLNPLAVARRAVRPLAAGTQDGLVATADALANADLNAALVALRVLRGLNPAVAAMSTAVATCEEIARVAPIRWRVRDRFASYVEAAPQLDYAVRNSRMVARRATVLLRIKDTCPPSLIHSIRVLAESFVVLGDELGEGPAPTRSRHLVLEAFAEARGTLDADSADSVVVMVAQVRSVAYDLLRASGLNRAQALELLDA
jgi:uncharacterized membrane protein YgaE (UPF0421/DUF939 family)